MAKEIHHEALYRRWRPQTFKEIVGQEHISQTLANALTGDRVAHAYLFCGPRGTGKTSTARVLAKALNCLEGPTPEPCGRCTSCVEIAEGSSLDVIEVDAASYRQVDETQEVLKGVHLAPAVGRKKVYIIDEVHMLSTHSFNALLKTLEEPPDHIVFILATTEPHRVLPTVLSRCQRFDFRRVPVDDLVPHLRSVVAAEEVKISDEAIVLIARHAQGSVRDALGALEMLVGFSGGKEIEASDATRLLGVVEFDALLSLVDRVNDGEAAEALLILHNLLEAGKEARTCISEIVGYLRRLFLVQHAGASAVAQDTPEEDRRRLQDQASRIDPSQLMNFLEVFGDAYEAARGGDARLVLEMAVVKLAKPQTSVSPAGLLKRIERLEAVSAGGGQSEPVKPRAPREEKKPEKKEAPVDVAGQAQGDLETIEKAWSGILERLKKKPAARACLIEAKPVGLEGKVLSLEFSPSSNFHRQRVEKEFAGVVKETVKEVSGVDVVLQCRLRSDSLAGEATEGVERPSFSMEEVVELVADEFDAKILSESDTDDNEPAVLEEG
ncbi:MAG: DNA polymerase III subunit gamma/tau [Candidatus Aquicultorales bacterium]